MTESAETREIIVVRSLTESDLGLFAAHRARATSNQRAININSDLAQRILAPAAFKAGGADLSCIRSFQGTVVHETRRLGKSGKNWRLGGKKIEGDQFAELDPMDLMLLRTKLHNEGRHPVAITFISKKSDRVVHAGLVAIVERRMRDSMAAFEEGQETFSDFAKHCPLQNLDADTFSWEGRNIRPAARPIPPIPAEVQGETPHKTKSIKEKLRQPHILEQMLKASGDLSAPAQLRFLETVDKLATQLRSVLLATGRIVRIERNHGTFWPSIKGQRTGFVDGGLANLSMLGSAPIAARVGGYMVTPGIDGPERENFTVLKYLIDELYAHDSDGIYSDSFPDIGALRDAARISIEAAGAVRMLSEYPDLKWLLVHGALVNPVSRYSDIMQEGQVRHRFPDFSDVVLQEFLPPAEPPRFGRDRNFISTHLRQLQLLNNSPTITCGVIERESTTTSVCRAVLASLDDQEIEDLLPVTPSEWKRWFRSSVDPAVDEDLEGQRITDSLLFRCVLEPGEALLPVEVDRNELRRAPKAWADIVVQYPKPQVSFLQVSEWSPPIRIEIFKKDIERFTEVAALVFHCALLLPRYSFPVGLDIVDKFARIPDWMSRPVNTHTTVRAMQTALDRGDERLFDALRRMLCGSGREFLLRPGIMR